MLFDIKLDKLYKHRVGTAEYKRALAAAIGEYERLEAQREAIETRLAQLRQTIGALGPLCKLPQHDILGLTDAIRSVLRARYGALTPVDVKDGLQTMGLDLSTYSNPLASIHAVLKRLARAGEILKQDDRCRKTVYAWKHPPIPVAITDGEGAIVAARKEFMKRWPGAKPSGGRKSNR